MSLPIDPTRNINGMTATFDMDSRAWVTSDGQKWWFCNSISCPGLTWPPSVMEHPRTCGVLDPGQQIMEDMVLICQAIKGVYESIDQIRDAIDLKNGIVGSQIGELDDALWEINRVLERVHKMLSSGVST